MWRCLALAPFVLLVVSGGTLASETTTIALGLTSSCRLAARHNSEVAGSYAAAELARSAVDKAHSALLPRVVVSSGFNYLSKETLFGSVPVLERETLQSRVALEHILYSGGRAQATSREAEYGYAAALNASKAMMADVLTRTATAYLRAQQAKKATEVAEASVKSHEASHDAAARQFEAGVVTRSDVLRSEVALASARASLIAARNSYAVALVSLKTAIGLPEDTLVTLTEDLSDESLVLDTGVEPAIRPEIAAGEQLVRAADAGARAARARRLPTAMLVADFLNEPEGSQFPRRTNSIGAGLMVTWNAFDGGLTRAGIAESDAAARRSREDLETIRRAVSLQIDTARLDLDSARARLRATSTQIESAEESLRALRAGYDEGITPIVDVLAGETALTEARVSRLVAEYDVKLSQVSLLRALGRTDTLLLTDGGK